ncbi:hypothetical protein RI129_008027 [Pyrocoelia pectoralis]|uniref:AN1-type domain-containing protein n=1 Tax=Pyrocoelia pectoralis TaxID=417401 RepID=A0AAN7ZIZ8_9COLE
MLAIKFFGKFRHVIRLFIYCFFSDEHYPYSIHNCTNAYTKNNQVPVCPLCNIPIPIQRGQLPDLTVSNHIDSDCQSDPAKQKRKVFTNKCSFKSCKTKEVIPIICDECTYNYCLKHRHTTDHNCEGKLAAMRKRNLLLQSDDEALARALALSMQDTGMQGKLKQEELDLALARQLQASESQTAVVGGSRQNRDRCNVS